MIAELSLSLLLLMPVQFNAPLTNSKIVSSFGKRFHPVTKKVRVHSGIDLEAKEGTPVRAMADGDVIFSGLHKDYGILMSLRHEKGYTTHYAHLNKALVRVGTRVRKGQFIGLTGATGRVTGPHLHLEVRYKGKAIDPAGIFKQKG